MNEIPLKFRRRAEQHKRQCERWQRIPIEAREAYMLHLQATTHRAGMLGQVKN